MIPDDPDPPPVETTNRAAVVGAIVWLLVIGAIIWVVTRP